MLQAVVVISSEQGGGRMWIFKKCPRCRGDLFIDQDTDRCYEKCLQCGYEHEVSGAKNHKPAKEKTGVK